MADDAALRAYHVRYPRATTGEVHMRDVYAATFLLGSPDGAASNEISAGATTTLRWMAARYALVDSSTWEAGHVEPGGDRATWWTEQPEGDARRLWQMNWWQAAEESSIVWLIRCQIGSTMGQTRFTMRLAIESTDQRVAPIRYEVGRPGVIGRLARAPGIHVDGRSLGTAATKIGSDDIRSLVDLLLDPGRQLPVIVVTPSDDTGRALVDPDALADRLIGLAHVMEIPARPVTFQLTDQVGQALSVFGGALRLYWPGLSRESNPYEHPLWFPARIQSYEASPRGVVPRLEQQLAGIAVVRVGADPLEAEFRSIRDQALVERASHLQSELERLAANPAGPGADWLAELQNAYDQTSYFAAETVRLQRDNADLRTDIEKLRRSFLEYAQAVDTAGESDLAEAPQDVSSSSEALQSARAYLPNVSIPGDVGLALDELDTAPEARSWGRTAWRAFRALSAYVDVAAEYAGFWDWCQRSGDPEAWPATEKKLAMSESETVVNSRTLREQRRFPVDPAVDESGRMLMYAHLKIAEGGGPQAPRIYFHDDTKGATRKVHVGFFGPHRLVANKGAN